MREAVVLLAVCAALGCSQKRSQRCEEVCQREATCAELLDDDAVVVNKSECVKQCNELERKARGQQLVGAHVECVEAAGDDCTKLLACP